MLRRNRYTSPVPVCKSLMTNHYNNIHDPDPDGLIDQLLMAKQQFVINGKIDKKIIEIAKEKIKIKIIPMFYNDECVSFFYGKIIDDLIARIRIIQ
jgi:hypothetical protein